MSDQIKQVASGIKDLREIAGFSAEALSAELGIAVETYREFDLINE